MMEHRKPAWWQLWMLVPTMFILMALEHFEPLPGVPDGVVDSVIVVLTFVGMLAWLQMNGGLLEWYYMEREESVPWLKITVYEPIEKMNGKDSGSASAEQSVLPLAGDGGREQVTTRLKEQDKWSLN